MNRRVYVVETVANGRWHVFASFSRASDAWAMMTRLRKQYVGAQFRTHRYVPADSAGESQ